jgi:hypothetical protein
VDMISEIPLAKIEWIIIKLESFLDVFEKRVVV